MTAGIECDGGPYCQAPVHIEGCFATAQPHGLTRIAGEIERLRTQLQGAVSRAEKAESALGDLLGRLNRIPAEHRAHVLGDSLPLPRTDLPKEA